MNYKERVNSIFRSLQERGNVVSVQQGTLDAFVIFGYECAAEAYEDEAATLLENEDAGRTVRFMLEKRAAALRSSGRGEGRK